MVQKIGHMQGQHVLIVTLTVSEVMHTRIMVEQIDRVQHVILIRGHELDLHEGKRPNVNHVMQSQ